MRVNRGGRSATFGDGPHDEALAAAHVAGDEHAVHVGAVVVGARDVAARVERDAELVEPRAFLRPHEPEREQHEISRQFAAGAGHRLELAVLQFHFVQHQRAHVAVAVVDELFGRHAEHALPAFFVGRRRAVHEAPLRPRVALGAHFRRSGHDLELCHRCRSLAVRGAEAVGAGVAAADDHHVLAGGGDAGLAEVAFLHLVGDRQVFHRLIDALQLAAGHGQIAPGGRAAREHHGVVGGAKHFDVDVVTDDGVGAKLGAFGLHLFDAAFDVLFFHLEFGDSVPQQPADAVGALKHHHVVAGAGQLLCGGEARRARADHCDAVAGAHAGHLRRHPTFAPCAVDDLDFDLLDGDGVLVDAQDARRLARRRAQATGELGEVVRGVQAVDRFAPVFAVDEVVPVRDEVAERAAVVAERDAAIHAAPGLFTQFRAVERLVHLAPVSDTHGDGPALGRGATPLQEPGCVTHAWPLSARVRCASAQA